MYVHKCLKAIAVCEITRQERMRAHEGLMLLTRKRSGLVKGRLVYNGKKMRDWISKGNASSPTAGTDRIMLTIVVDAFEH